MPQTARVGRQVDRGRALALALVVLVAAHGWPAGTTGAGSDDASLRVWMDLQLTGKPRTVCVGDSVEYRV